MKNYKDWQNSETGMFSDFCNVGDIVGYDIVQYFGDVLPPFTLNTEEKEVLQCSEPLDTDKKGKFLYITFTRDKKVDKWIYTIENKIYE